MAVPDRRREARALVAAHAVARAHGLVSHDAVVLAAGSNVLVHLRPAPVVARVMTGTEILHDDVEEWLAREVEAGAFLGERGLAVPPSDLLPPGPHRHDGLWLTFWRHVEHDASGVPDATDLGRSLRGLHAALADFPGDLPSLSGVRDDIDRLLAELRQSPTRSHDDIDSLRSELQRLTPTVFETPLPAQALHGDASIGNLLRTDAGLVWNDLEDVCTGPVEWDVAGVVMSARIRGRSEAFVAALLDAYGGPALDELDDFLAAHALYLTVWRSFTGATGPSASAPAGSSGPGS
jgi:hypothetical protein